MPILRLQRHSEYDLVRETHSSRTTICTMTTGNRTHDGAQQRERDRAVEALTEALETDDGEEIDYQIREALQLLTLKTE